MPIEGKQLYLGGEPIQLIQNNGFVHVDPTTITPPLSWTPEDFTNVQYWWTADAGVTESSGVIEWEDQINGYTMVDAEGVSSGTKPTLTTSATLNGQNVISFNGTSDFLYTTTIPAAFGTNDVTMLAVFNLVDTKTGGSIMGAVRHGNGIRFWMDADSGDYRVVNQDIFTSGGGTYTVESPASTGANAFKLRYDRSLNDAFVAQNTLTETTMGTSGQSPTFWDEDATVAIGASIRGINGEVFNSRYVEIEMAEQVWIYGSPSTDEMNDWKSYVNTKYGTIIS